MEIRLVRFFHITYTWFTTLYNLIIFPYLFSDLKLRYKKKYTHQLYHLLCILFCEFKGYYKQSDEKNRVEVIHDSSTDNASTPFRLSISTTPHYTPLHLSSHTTPHHIPLYPSSTYHTPFKPLHRLHQHCTDKYTIILLSTSVHFGAAWFAGSRSRKHKPQRCRG